MFKCIKNPPYPLTIAVCMLYQQRTSRTLAVAQAVHQMRYLRVFLSSSLSACPLAALQLCARMRPERGSIPVFPAATPLSTAVRAGWEGRSDVLKLCP